MKFSYEVSEPRLVIEISLLPHPDRHVAVRPHHRILPQVPDAGVRAHVRWWILPHNSRSLALNRCN